MATDPNTIRLGDLPIISVRVMENGAVLDGLSEVDTKVIKVRSPAGVTSEYDATFRTDGEDGWIEYQTEEGDIDAVGVWKFSGKVVDDAGRPFETWPETLKVNAAL